MPEGAALYDDVTFCKIFQNFGEALSAVESAGNLFGVGT